MIRVAESVKTALNSPVRSIAAKVELYNGSTLVDTFNHNDRLINFTVERVGENSKFFGFGICQHAKITILDVNREIDYITTAHSFKIKYTIGSTTFSAHPTFYITQTRRDENTNALTIYGYDMLYPASARYVSELTFPENPRLLDYMMTCINALGSTTAYYYGLAASDPLLSMRYPTGANFEGSETFRDMLDDFAEATQTIYYVNHQNQICWKRLNNPNATSMDIMEITKDKYFTLTTKDGRRLQSICSATQLGENIIFSGTEIGSTQYVRDNGFWELREDIATLVENAVAAIGGLSIRQFDCFWRGYILVEPGDKLKLTTKDNQVVESYLLDDVVEYDGGLSQKTKWSYTDNEGESVDNPTSLGDALKMTYAKVDKVNKEIELVARDIRSEMDERFASLNINPDGILAEVARIEKKIDDGLAGVDAEIQETEDGLNASIGNIENRLDNEVNKIYTETAALKLKADGIEASVSQIDNEIAGVVAAVNAKVSAEDVEISIQKAMEQGVEAITTTTGFTFNEEGLHVSKSNSDITTSITEDGMTVLRKDEAVLVADNLGVRAEDLHATTFLIIGNNSRLEDYQGNRTGCFWIGN